MPLLLEQISQLAQSLLDAEQRRAPINKLSDQYPEIDELDAYRIAHKKFELRGQRKTGYKLGYTSEAMRRQMNISSPNYGLLTEDQWVQAREIEYDSLIHPLIEPEIAVFLGRDLPSQNNCTLEAIYAAEPKFMPALEVCDTRYLNYQFKAVDNIADNSSAARYVLGSPVEINDNANLKDRAVELWIDGEKVDAGIGSNALGDPLWAVLWLVNRLAEQNESLKAGEVVLTGGLTKGYLVKPGQQITNKIKGVSEVTVQFV
jgi:2-keto-4-pentenoate hydratase